MTNAAANLDRLHDIIVPAPVSWWPPAPAWYWVLGLVLVLVLVLAIRALIHWQRSCYRREALAELSRIEQRLHSPTDRAAILLALAELLKRVALTAFPREQVATLTGAPWFAFLDRTASGLSFSDGLGMAWETSVYDRRAADTLDGQKLQCLTWSIRHWITYHHAEIEPKKARDARRRSGDKPLRPSFPSVQDSSVQKPC